MPLGSAERRLNPHFPPVAHRFRRAVATTAAAALVFGASAAGSIVTSSPAWAEATGSDTIASELLSVQVSTAFPQALKYTQASSGKSLNGSTAVATAITINGTDQPVQVSAQKTNAKTMDYVLTPSNLAGVSLNAQLSVDGAVVTFKITKITDTAQNRVNNLQIKNQDLVTVSSTEPSATVASASISVNRAVSGDTITPITANTPVDSAAKKANLTLVSTNQLAAGLDTNSLYDSASPNAGSEGGRFWRQAVSDGSGGIKMGVSSGAWLYRAAGSDQTEELPWSKVIISADANADGAVDWQDAAIAYRSIERKPLGSADVKNRVITHIPFNFASQATNPFLRTLDNVKRIAAATDGLGQMALLKGYTSEGHDSANSDFGGNYNERAGGLADMNTLLKDGAAYGATFGVHINATEAYPEANSFSEQLVDKTRPNWNWLDQAYFINQNWDIGSGSLENRIKQLRSEAGANLTMTYVDTYYTPGWAAYRTQKALNDAGFSVTSEWSNSLASNTTWSHWSADEKYGGSNNKGINSQILRFIGNGSKDTWNPDPLLGNAQIKEFEGWTGQNDYNAFSKNIWSNNLPTKFLQQQEITKWNQTGIELTGGLNVTGSSKADRVISQEGKAVLRGSNYLLPWSAAAPKFGDQAVNDPNQRKLYHYSENGGSSTWQLTGAFAQARSLTMYKLTDNGRELAGVVPVVSGSVNLTALPNQPYVLVPDVSVTTVATNPGYGAGTPFKDPGFNAGNLQAWNPTGGATIERMDKGQLVAKLGSSVSGISQQLAPLKAGTYSVSAWVEIQPGQKRPTTLTVTPSSGAPVSVTVDQSGAKNWVGADEKRDTYFQRLRVLVDAKAGDTAQLRISAAAGTASVRIDDVRAVLTQRVPSTGVVAEDFENTDQGWGPFVKSDAGGVNDPRTHIAKRNAPYTQTGWNNKTTSDVLAGDYSLHSHGENAGLVYRTSNYTVPMQAGRQYKVSFDYQASAGNGYSWVSGYDTAGRSVETNSTPIGTATGTARWSQTITASACGASWVGLRNATTGKGEFSMDNLLVEDLGVSTATPACGSLQLTAGQDLIQPGAKNRFTSNFDSAEPAAIAGLNVTLGLPEGWKATAKSPATAATLPAGGALKTEWEVDVPASAKGDFTITAAASYRTTASPLGERSVSTEAAVNTLPDPPAKDTYASDLRWIGTPSNGWGPVEKDQANGEQGQGDGPPLTLAGKVYAKGLGAHAASSIRYYLGTQCSMFTAVIGIDDKQGSKGQAVFSVVGDGTTLYTSPTMKGGAAPEAISVPLNGAKYVDLKADVVGGNNGNAWADWANAKFLCSAPVTPRDLQPELSVAADTLTPGASFTVRVPDLSPGSELKAELRSDPVELGTATAETDGIATLPVTVPSSTALGEHQIVVNGTDNNGLAATGSVAVTVVAASTGSGTDVSGSSRSDGSGTGGSGTGGSGTAVQINAGSGTGGDDLAVTGFQGWQAPLGLALLLVLTGVAALTVRRHRSRV